MKKPKKQENQRKRQKDDHFNYPPPPFVSPSHIISFSQWHSMTVIPHPPPPHPWSRHSSSDSKWDWHWPFPFSPHSSHSSPQEQEFFRKMYSSDKEMRNELWRGKKEQSGIRFGVGKIRKEVQAEEKEPNPRWCYETQWWELSSPLRSLANALFNNISQ